MNNTLGKLQNNAPAEKKFYAASFLGKKVITNGTTVSWNKDGNSPIHFLLNDNAEKVFVRIFDKSGSMVRQLEYDNLSRGNQRVVWDGKQMDGEPAGTGTYHIQVAAWDTNYQPVKSVTKVAGNVEGVEFENGEVVFLVEGRKVNLSDVDSFLLPEKQQNKNIVKKNIPQKMAMESFKKQ